jgi:hypothetical protein
VLGGGGAERASTYLVASNNFLVLGRKGRVTAKERTLNHHVENVANLSVFISLHRLRILQTLDYSKYMPNIYAPYIFFHSNITVLK